MWVVRATEVDDLPRLKIQRGQEPFKTLFDREYSKAMTMVGSVTGEWNGDPMCVAGIVERWKGCGLAHAIISCEAGPHFNSMIRSIRAHLEGSHTFRRVEAYVRTDWDEAHRMAKVLGFKREGTMHDFDPFGRDCDLYARTFKWTQ
jgi:hypothetical protein